jgi:hypothetical protein
MYGRWKIVRHHAQGDAAAVVRSIRRGAAAAVLALAIAPLASACAAGDDAATLQVQPDSQSASKGDVKVQNAFVLTDPAGGPATVTARLFNNSSSAQSLESVEIADIGTATLHGPHGAPTVDIPAHSSVTLGGKGNPAAVLDTAAANPRNGDVQNAVFSFSRSGRLKMLATVLPATGYYAPFGPSTTPTPTATGTPAGSTPGATETTTPSSTPTSTSTTPTSTPTS